MEQTTSRLLHTQGMDSTTSITGFAGLSFGMKALTGELQSQGILEAGARSVVEGMFMSAFNPIGDAALLGTMAAAGVKATDRLAKKGKGFRRSLGGPNVGGGYQDTQQAYTMRQRAVQAIQQSRMNARSVLGNEASLLHR